MRKHFIFSLTLMALVALGGALEKGHAEEPPSLAMFGSYTCQYCQQMLPVIDEVARIYQGSLIMRHIEITEYPQAVYDYDIDTTPTFILFDPYGNEVFRYAGALPMQTIQEILSQAGIYPQKN